MTFKILLHRTRHQSLIVLALIFTLLTLLSCSAIPDRRSSGIILKDENIESKATNSLYENTKINKKIHVNVTSYNGIVLVTGEVLTEDLRNQVITTISELPDVK